MAEYTMSPERWAHTQTYLRELFAREDEHQRSLMPRAIAAGIPAIDVGPEAGRFLQMLALMLRAKLIIEVGTLAGSSAIWLARGLMPGGRVITVDLSETHLDFAKQEIAAANLTDRVQFRQGKGGEVLPVLLRELGPAKADMVFLDAERSEYIPLLPTVAKLLRPGGVLAIDNALAAQRWVADPYKPGEPRDVMDETNRAVAGHPDFIASHINPLGNGTLIAVRKD
ncbi:MAG: class I SAM-dependent methyltransferase [Phycisphaerales bacterium]|nr:class I SAM-dependent methyltransferase [Phycisphaerales bacterium]